MALNFLKRVTGVSGGCSKYVFGLNLMKYNLHQIDQFHCIKTKMGKCVQGSPNIKNGKKGDIVTFRRPPPKHLLSEKERKSRQMRFRDKTA